MKNLKDNMQELVDDVAAAGIPFIVCANIPTSSKAEVQEGIEILNRTGAAAKKAGLTLAYHNHDAEFKEVDGVVPYTAFLNHLDAGIQMELDLAWASKAGHDPVELFEMHPGRFPLWHVKDLDKDGNIVPVGSGTIDFKKIFSHASHAGLKHCFVEHDMPKDALASITESYRYIRQTLSV
jgi:sugar phosphate isomerase/epimerase